MHRIRLLLLGVALALSAAAATAQTAPATEHEVGHLLDYLAHSGCEFYRNGKWYPAADARSHLQRKYRYLRDRDLVETAEDFVRRAASQSSMSGKPYQVKCRNAAPVASAQWLQEELQRYRGGERNQK